MVEIMDKLLSAMNEYGPVLVMVAVLLMVNGFFIWRDWKREERQQKQIDALHASQDGIVLPLMVECKEVIASCKEVIAQNSQVIMRLIGGIKP